MLEECQVPTIGQPEIQLSEPVLALKIIIDMIGG